MTTQDQYKNPSILTLELLLLEFAAQNDGAIDIKSIDKQTTPLYTEAMSLTKTDVQKTTAAIRVSLQHLLAIGMVTPISDLHVHTTNIAKARAGAIRVGFDGSLAIFGHPISTAQWAVFESGRTNMSNHLEALKGKIGSHLENVNDIPKRILCLQAALAQFANLTHIDQRPYQLEFEDFAGAAIIVCREQLLLEQENKLLLGLRARERDMLRTTESNIASLEFLLNLETLKPYLGTGKPRITDFVNVGIVESKRGGPGSARTPDEKFSILSAPSHFASDYKDFAEAAFSRDRSFAVAFIDIDDFKKFNSRHTETEVDQHMLPYFMRAVEAYCYGRGVAYRQGGDEYLVLLRNADEHEARFFFDGLRKHIGAITYGTAEINGARPTVSIGVHVIDGANEITRIEAQKRANEAKNLAKLLGKNRVALSSDPRDFAALPALEASCTGLGDNWIPAITAREPVMGNDSCLPSTDPVHDVTSVPAPA